MSDNKILQAIDYLETQKRLFPKSFNVLSGHFDTAISALQDQAEREKGCMWCKEGAFDDSHFKVNFCPVCGRDLRKPVNPNE